MISDFIVYDKIRAGIKFENVEHEDNGFVIFEFEDAQSEPYVIIRHGYGCKTYLLATNDDRFIPLNPDSDIERLTPSPID